MNTVQEVEFDPLALDGEEGETVDQSNGQDEDEVLFDDLYELHEVVGK